MHAETKNISANIMTSAVLAAVTPA